MGGLACGRMLSKRGLKVAVLERQIQPGGSLQSYTRRGRHFDTGMHYVGGLDEGQALHELFAELNLLSLPWKRLDPEGFDRVTIGERTFLYKEGYDMFAQELSCSFPSEKESLQTYVRTLRDMGEKDGTDEEGTAPGASSHARDLGPLPVTAVILLAALAAAWAGILVWMIAGSVRNRQKRKGK